MCVEPVTALAIAGGAVTAMGQIRQGQAAAAAASAGAQAAEQEGAARETAVRDRARRLLGAQRAAAAGSGIDLSGSFLDVVSDDAATAELDALTARTVASNAAAQERAQGRAARTNATAAAVGTTLLTGANAWQRSAGPAAVPRNPVTGRGYGGV